MQASLLEASPAPEPAGLDWRNLAACRGQTAFFFPPTGERPANRERREAAARSLCLACPVLWACRRWAREHREYGYWGAESEEERAAAGYCVNFPVGRVAQARREWQREVAATAGAAGQTGGPTRIESGEQAVGNAGAVPDSPARRPG